jgi:hypothetical protein
MVQKYAIEFFGRLLNIPGTIYQSGHVVTSGLPDSNSYDSILWIVQDEDYYSLMSPEIKDKRILVVREDDARCTRAKENMNIEKRVKKVDVL